MKPAWAILEAVFLSALLGACKTSTEATRELESSELLYLQGHELYLNQHYDSALVVLKKATDIDETYREPLLDLGALHYDRGVMERGESNSRRQTEFEHSLRYYSKAEALGAGGSDLYERLCELSVALSDNRSFLKYARKNAEAYPYDRQYFNLGLAYIRSEDFRNAIKVLKEGVGKFKSSAFIGGFYRQLGLSYMNVDRDQTAERTFVAGLQAVDERVAEMKSAGPAYSTGNDYRRLVDDKVGMLLSLKKLHQLYGAKDKLAEVERQLREAGHNK